MLKENKMNNFDRAEKACYERLKNQNKKTDRVIELEKKLDIAVKALKWIEEQADTSTQYDYEAEVILKNIVFDAQQTLKEIEVVKVKEWD